MGRVAAGDDEDDAVRGGGDNLVGELLSWPGKVVKQAYQSPFAVHAVFRALPPIARQYVLRVLFCTPDGSSIPANTLHVTWPAHALPTTTSDCEKILNNNRNGALNNAADNASLPSATAALRPATCRAMHENALELLQKLRILEQQEQTARGSASSSKEVPSPPSTPDSEYIISEPFREQLLDILSNRTRRPFSASTKETQQQQQQAEPEPVNVDAVARLEKYSKVRWERVLHFLVGTDDDPTAAPGDTTATTPGAAESAAPKSSTSTTPPPSEDLVKALLSAGLLEPCDEGLRITHVGFQFLLKDTYAQTWVLLMRVVRNTFPSNTAFRLGAMDLLFQLAFCVVGRMYATSTLSPPQVRLMNALDELGLIMIDQRRHAFYVTRVGACLMSSERNAVSAHAERHFSAELGELHLIVETNFRVYAYTTSSFQVALLSLFMVIRYRLPNLAVGHLTKGSARAAMANGITAKQIIHFLDTHVHPMVTSGAIPSCVSDELRLWEAEQDRVGFTPAVIIDDLASDAAFARIRKHATECGALLWAHARRRVVVVKSERADQVKRFMLDQEIH